MLKMSALVSGSDLPDWIDEIEAEVLKWQGTSISMHRYGGVQFNCMGKEMGHLHSNGLLDVLYSQKIKAKLLTDARIEHHHIFKNSGWISFYLKSFDDMKYAQRLLMISYLNILRRTHLARHAPSI
jgi:hypothetical protein